MVAVRRLCRHNDAEYDGSIHDCSISVKTLAPTSRSLIVSIPSRVMACSTVRGRPPRTSPTACTASASLPSMNRSLYGANGSPAHPCNDPSQSSHPSRSLRNNECKVSYKGPAGRHTRHLQTRVFLPMTRFQGAHGTEQRKAGCIRDLRLIRWDRPNWSSVGRVPCWDHLRHTEIADLDSRFHSWLFPSLVTSKGQTDQKGRPHGLPQTQTSEFPHGFVR